MTKIAESIQRARMKRNERAAALKTALEKAETMQRSLEMNSLKEILDRSGLDMDMDMNRAIAAAHTLYRANPDNDLKEILDRAELSWNKWHDTSDYRPLMEKCADIITRLF